jgi:trehalose 6-phosphate phosphatase
MRYALSMRSREDIARFVAQRCVFAFDFDGTLSPIVTDPGQAGLPRSTMLLLRRVATIGPCVAVSGRSRDDLARRLAGAGIRLFIGNHGAESETPSPPVLLAVQRWKRILERSLPVVPGLWIEDKALSLTVHFRMCKRKAEARLAISRAAELMPEARMIEGKQCVSIVSPGAADKGQALCSAMKRLRVKRALYVGDDVTDEDVFKRAGEGQDLFTVRVGRKTGSAASYFLHRQSEIDELLRAIIDC